jgi:hypothetical protein
MSWELFVKNKLNEDIWGQPAPGQAQQGMSAAPASAPVQKEPKEGDLATVKVRGISQIGKLTNVQNNGREFVGQLIPHGPADSLNASNMGQLTPISNSAPINVGSITWDNVQKLWHALDQKN